MFASSTLVANLVEIKNIVRNLRIYILEYFKTKSKKKLPSIVIICNFFYETMQFVTKNMILKKKQLENFVVSFRIEFKIYSSQFENN